VPQQRRRRQRSSGESSKTTRQDRHRSACTGMAQHELMLLAAAAASGAGRHIAAAHSGAISPLGRSLRGVALQRERLLQQQQWSLAAPDAVTPQRPDGWPLAPLISITSSSLGAASGIRPPAGAPWLRRGTQQRWPPGAAARGLHTTTPSTSTTTASGVGHGALQPHDLSDALKLAELIHRFRARGHLVAQLDPLRRCAGGPWVGPVGRENDRCDATLTALISGWPEEAGEDARAAFVGRQLGLAGPATAARRLPVGQLMPGEGWWRSWL
jgi:hypothetical protein